MPAYENKYPDVASPAAVDAAIPTDPVDALQRSLVPFIGDGSPDVSFAAELCRVSVLTLQRRLGAAGVTYSGLVDRARFDAAAARLVGSDERMIDVALDLGYRDPGSFTRAFRRWTGLTPRAFRARSRRAAD